MVYVFGIILALCLISYGVSCLKEAIVNTSKAVRGEEKIKESSIMSWMNLITIFVIAIIIYIYAF